MRDCHGVRLLAVSLLISSGCGDDDTAARMAVDSGFDSAKGGEAAGSGGSLPVDASMQSGGGAGGTAALDAGAGGALDGGADAEAPDASDDDSLCAKYGGPEAVMSVMRNQVLSEIAGDCRINAFFAVVDPVIVDHVGQCLGFMAQELFGCPGVAYEGSESSTGRPCRSMEESHRGLRISKGDFDALLEDVVAGLGAAGVEDDDIARAAPALIGMQDDIVEAPDNEETTQFMCEAGAADGGSSEGGSPDAAGAEGGTHEATAGDGG